MELSKKQKDTGIIVLLVSVIIVSIVAIIVVYTKGLTKEDADKQIVVTREDMDKQIVVTEEVSDSEGNSEIPLQDFDFPLLISGKQLYISYFAETAFDVALEDFVKQDRDDDVIEFTNNEKKIGSMHQSFKYFFNETQLLDEYADVAEIAYQYEKEVLADDNPIYYIQKSTPEDKEEMHAGDGRILMWEPTIKAGQYDASQIISYYNVTLPEGETRGYAFTDNSTLMNTYCIISLDQLDETEMGYLVFEGVSSVGSEINYCDWLNDAKVFELTIK